MINTKDIAPLKNSLANIIALKYDPRNGEYLNASINMAEIMHALLDNRSDSNAYRDAYTALLSMGRNMKSLKLERQQENP